ncbi:MAG: 50S ribosomal protein L32 [Chloroflexi bacterium]|nr:50S ribosomal protein L32 [Chloroflexota bacterium]
MPVPKKKTPKSRQGKHRSHLRKYAPKLSACTRCHSPRLPHHACPSCGFYKGRDAVVVAKPELPA